MQTPIGPAPDVDETLKERNKIYGDYFEGALLRIELMSLLENRHVQANGEPMNKIYKSMLWDIINKLTRLAVTPTDIDTIHDIGGFSKLYENHLRKNEGKNDANK